MKAGNDKEAQEAYDSYLKIVQASRVEANDMDVTQQFWRAIAKDGWTEATNLLDQPPLFLPSFIREAMKGNPEKLKLLKELSDAQMDALWDYCKWNVALEDCLVNYNTAEEDWKMAEVKAKYEKTVEKMSLLNEDIHGDFDFTVPVLPGKNSHMQEVYDKLESKTPAFETAFANLRKDKSLDMMLVIDAMYNLTKPKDQVALLDTVRHLKSKGSFASDNYLIDVLICAAKKEPVDKRIDMYLVVADFKVPQNLGSLIEALERMRKSGGSPLEHATFDFYKMFASLVQGLTAARFAEKSSPSENETLLDNLNSVAGTSPFDIERLGKQVSIAKIVAEGTPLLEQSVLCIKLRLESEPANATYKQEYAFAQGYLDIFKTAKGENMTDKTIFDQIIRLKVKSSKV